MTAAGVEHDARNVEQRVAIAVDEVRERRTPLGDPRAVEQHSPSFAKWREVDVAGRSTDLNQARAGGIVKRRTFRHPAPVAILLGQHAEPERPGRQHGGARRRPARERILVIVAIENVEDARSVLHRQREDRNAIERGAVWDEPTGRHSPHRGFDADDAIEARRNASRSAGVGAEREGDVTGRNRNR